MSRFRDEDTSLTDGEWVTYDERMERLAQLRSQSENGAFSVDERHEAYERAGWLRPTPAEWDQARAIEEQRWHISRERKAAKQQRPPHPLTPPHLACPVPADPDASTPVGSARASRLMRAIYGILTEGGAVPTPQRTPPKPRVRTDPWESGRYWYYVELERKRRAWMTAQGFPYVPRLAVIPGDLDQARP